MKFIKTIVAVCLFGALTTGCNLKNETPDELIIKPTFSIENKGIYDAIERSLDKDTSLILPLNSKEIGKINKVDLNNDKVDEFVAFQKKEDLDKGSKVGFLVVDRNIENQNYSFDIENGVALLEGESIEYANFLDLDNDGYKEIILFVKSEDKYNLLVYKYINGKVQLIRNLDSKNLGKNIKVSDAKVKIDHMDNDNKLDILLLYHDTDTKKMYSNIISFEENDLIVKDTLISSNVKDLKNLHITVGNITSYNKNNRGIILTIPMVDNINLTTQIIYKDKDNFIKVFDEKNNESRNNKFKRRFYIAEEDINNDKVLEIPIADSRGNTNNTPIVTWYIWNGKIDEAADLILNSQVYYNFRHNFKFEIPNILVGKINVEPLETDEKGYKFKFSIYKNEKSKELFTILVSDKTKTTNEKGDLSSQNGDVLTENEDFIIFLNGNYNKAELNSLNIYVKTLHEDFKPIYKVNGEDKNER